MLYAFGDYELDTQLYELRHAGKPLKIEPQVFKVFAYLIQHPDRTVTKHELLEHLCQPARRRRLLAGERTWLLWLYTAAPIR